MKPKVTILVNTMNEKPEWLVKSLDSHLANKVPCQIIVSTMLHDSNFALLMDYKRKSKIELFFCDPAKHPGRSPEGCYYQINSALHLIKGEWFYYFSSNDWVTPTKIKDELNACVKNNRLICYSSFHVINNKEHVIGTRIEEKQYGKYDYKKHLRGNFITDASLIKTDLLKKYMPFKSKEYGNFAHWDLWLRIFETEGDVFVHNKNISFYYRQNPEAMHILRRNNYQDQIIAKKALVRLMLYNNRKSKRNG